MLPRINDPRPFVRSAARALAGFIVMACLIVDVGIATALAGSAPIARKPNVLIFLADDQRADTIAALGNMHVRTPNLDRLVREGTSFSRAYCMGSLQGAVCVPSRAMLLSGRSLFRVHSDLKGQPTWPEAFARNGYTTFLTGKWHNEPESAVRVFQEGKAIFFGGMGNPYALSLQDISPEHALVNRRLSGEHSVQRFADAAVEFLRARKGDKPFLCDVSFNLPHDPRVAPASYHARYKAARPPLPANFLPLHPFNNGSLVIRDEELAPWPRSPEIVRQHLADYYACIEFVDAQVGRVLDALQASGQYENTLIVYTSDHGLAIGSHGLFGKQSLYEHSMRSPLIFAGPGTSKGLRTDAMCYLLDIFPTLGELARVPAPEGNEGQSLVPVLNGRRRTNRESIFTAYGGVQRAVRDERWKLIVYPDIHKSQLFDLQADPAEVHDLAGSSIHASEVARLTKLIREWQGRLGDSLSLRAKKRQPAEFDFSNVKSPAPEKVSRP